jgi:hypothetical protein
MLAYKCLVYGKELHIIGERDTRLLTTFGTGGEVKFPAQDERVQNEKEHDFRLRHQYHFRGSRLA